jgi:hypothetical protein
MFPSTTRRLTSRISRSAGTQSFEGAHRGRVSVHVFIGVSMRACCERLRCTMSISKKTAQHRHQEARAHKYIHTYLSDISTESIHMDDSTRVDIRYSVVLPPVW